MTNTGRVEAIHIAPAAEAPMTSVGRVQAVAGVGLEGDRYAARGGTWAADNLPKSGAHNDPKTRDEDEGCIDNGCGNDVDGDGRSKPQPSQRSDRCRQRRDIGAAGPPEERDRSAAPAFVLAETREGPDD